MRLAVVGAGSMGARLAEAVQAREDAVVAAVVDPDLDRAAALARRLGGAAAFEGLEAALAATELDAVYIGSPNDTHATLCVRAAEAGLDILVDKPMALSAAEAEAVGDAVDRAGVRLMVGFSYRFRAEWRQAREWLRQGLLGRVHAVADTLVESAAATPAWYWQRSRGGGVVQLQAHHCFDRTAWLLGEAVRVTGCVTPAAAGDDEAESAAVLMGRSAGGVPLGFSIAFSPGHSAPAYAVTVIQGSSGTLVIDSVARRATLSGTAGHDAVLDAAGDDWLAREVDAFARVGGDGEDAPGWAEGRAAVECAESALHEAERPVECQTWPESVAGAVDRKEGPGWRTSRM